MTTTPHSLVYVVDDDPGVRKMVRMLLESVGLPVQTYSAATEFLDHFDPPPLCCLVLDVRMPGMDGLALQAHLHRQGHQIPTVIITGHADVPMAVQAMRAGALDFIEKPFREQTLLDAVQRALRSAEEAQRSDAHRAEARRKLAQLSPREREVMELLVEGQPTKGVAAALGVSIQAIAAHRARILEKLELDSLPELVRLVMAADDTD